MTIAPTSTNGFPPSPHLPSSSYAFHPLHTLFFCEECDLVRCNRCVSIEVSGYYCPNCLFEVPSASVRAEKNRCARNCFQCPHCRNTLSVVPSDPPEPLSGSSPAAATGDPPFFLFCNYCRWDSTTVGITFEKPTGLALQLQKIEDSQPEAIEFERLKEHFEPLIRASNAGGTSQAAPNTQNRLHHPSAAQQAASSALSREVPVLRRGQHQRANSNPKVTPASDAVARARKIETMSDSEWKYKARIDVVSGMGMALENELEWLRDLGKEETEAEGATIGDISEVDKRWNASWLASIKASDLKPLRIPLHSKKTKRCPDCRHILIKPEQKAQSVRYKIKLMAANYLPSIEVMMDLPSPIAAASTTVSSLRGKPRASVAGGSVEDTAPMMLAGKSYPFQLSFTNPLYEPITVRLVVHRPDSAPRPPFAISLPSASFPISAYAEAWEYEDDDDLDDDELEEILSGATGGAADRAPVTGKKGKSGKGAIGVLERKANTTRIGGEVMISKEATGEVKFNMQVSYTYRADEPAAEDTKAATSGKHDSNKGEMKTFTFFTCVNLGSVSPYRREKEKSRQDLQAGGL